MKSYTTQDLKNNIATMEDEKLDLDAPIQVYIDGESEEYEVENLGHFHAVPNMTMSLKLKNRVPNDSIFTLAKCLDLYNFRTFVNDKENTKLVRIYTEFPDYIELGVNEWGNSKNDIIKTTINKKLLSSRVVSFEYDDTKEVFVIYLEQK